MLFFSLGQWPATSNSIVRHVRTTLINSWRIRITFLSTSFSTFKNWRFFLYYLYGLIFFKRKVCFNLYGHCINNKIQLQKILGCCILGEKYKYFNEKKKFSLRRLAIFRVFVRLTYSYVCYILVCSIFLF